MSRKNTKTKKRIKCSYINCNKDPFKKALGFYYRGKYFCSKSHARKAFKEKAIKENK